MLKLPLLKNTVEAGMKFVPVSTTVRSAAPTEAVSGVTDASVGRGLTLGMTANGKLFDVPPPGVGLSTVMIFVPGTARAVWSTDAVSRVLLTYVVGRAVPFH